MRSRYEALREEFEPVLISTNGLHFNADLCRRSWDQEVRQLAKLGKGDGGFGEGLEEEIARGDAWLKLCRRTKYVNKRGATSYGLKHIVEGWWRVTRGGNGYLCNGAFLMAAHRLGFQMEGAPGNYCFGGGFVYDCFNAWINISSHGRPGVLPGGVIVQEHHVQEVARLRQQISKGAER